MNNREGIANAGAVGTEHSGNTPRGGFPRFFDERAETLSRVDIQSLQESRLERMLSWALANVPLIQRTWQRAGVEAKDIRSLQDFVEKAPFTSKDVVRQFRDANSDPFGGLNGVHAQDLKGVTFTSGTTGDPTPILRGGLPISELCTVRDAWMIGARPGDYVTLIRPTFRIGHPSSAYAEAGIIPILFKHHPSIMADLVAAVKLYQPACHLFLSNPLLIALEEYFERTHVDPVEVFRQCQGATVGGEPLSPRLQRLVQGWGLELFEVGGLGDSVTMVDCRAHDGMHAWEDHVMVECLAPQDDAPVSEGAVGELVVTVLTDFFLPLIRYRTDDLVTIKRDRCVCGRTHARIRIVGRRSDQVIVSGKVILPRDLQLVIEADRPTRAGLYQIIYSAPHMDVLRVRIGYEPEAHQGPLETLSERLRHALEEALGLAVEVELTLNAELLKLGPPHKIPRVARS
jgi:phenylacetate-CoA ligase